MCCEVKVFTYTGVRRKIFFHKGRCDFLLPVLYLYAD